MRPFGLRGPDLSKALELLHHRGPDDRSAAFGEWWAMGQTRLAILDLNPRARCPFVYGSVVLTYNGELWNYRELRSALEVAGFKFETTGDTEVVAAMLYRYGTDALPRLEGMFAMVWHDEREDALYAARDRYGEVPLHVAPLEGGLAYASEVRALRSMTLGLAAWVEPGTVTETRKTASGSLSTTTRHWYRTPARPVPVALEAAGETMRGLLARAVRERAISDVPVCTLLSGGIDSTAVAFHLRAHFPNLVAYTAVHNERSQDARMARLAAERLEIELVEVKVPTPTPDDLAGIIDRIEMPYKAQVEIGWACLYLARQMQADGFKVCFSGEGSDELWASYGFAYHVLQRTFAGRQVFGPGQVYDEIAETTWCEYRRKLFTDQHRKNFPRCNKIFLAHGVECRLPFLHTPLVEWALSVPVDVCVVRKPSSGPSKQKAVMYQAYDGLVPDEIVRRHKVAFQEGMGLKDAIAKVVHNPRVFYGAEYKRRFA